MNFVPSYQALWCQKKAKPAVTGKGRRVGLSWRKAVEKAEALLGSRQ